MIKKIITFLLLLLSIESIIPTIDIEIGNTFIWWLINFFTIIILLICIKKNRKQIKLEYKNLIFVKLYIIWFIFSFIRGIIIADNYWEYKNAVSSFLTMMIPIVTYLCLDPNFFTFIISRWIKFSLPFLIIFYPLIFGDGVGRYITPISILLLFLPLFNNKNKFLISLSVFIIFMGDLDARSNIIKYSMSFIFGFLAFFNIYKNKLLKVTYFIILPLPFILLTLGITGIFNIFKMEEYISKGDSIIINNNKNKGLDVNITADTRTFIYQEVISSAIKNNYYIFGRTPARGNDSEYFGWENINLSGKKERFANEVSITNVFTWSGLIGLLLYFLIFAKSSYLCIFKSKNTYAKIFGLFILFRWCYAWVEDFSNFDLSYFTLWMCIGLGYSSNFRKMNELEVKEWINKVFNNTIIFNK